MPGDRARLTRLNPAETTDGNGNNANALSPNATRSAVADSIGGPWTELSNPCVGENAEITLQSQGTFALPLAGQPAKIIFLADRWIKDDLADSRYIWLRIGFTPAGKPEIRWMDKWSPN